jgi:hypothetical protein
MTEPTYSPGQWVRSLPVGKAPSFIAQIIEREGDAYIVRDDWRRRFARKADELESLQ